MSSSNTIVLLYPSLAKRGRGRFYQHIFKIPLCQRGIKHPRLRDFDLVISFELTLGDQPSEMLGGYGFQASIDAKGDVPIRS